MCGKDLFIGSKVLQLYATYSKDSDTITNRGLRAAVISKRPERSCVEMLDYFYNNNKSIPENNIIAYGVCVSVPLPFCSNFVSIKMFM